MSRLARFPFFVILMGLAGLAMLPPAIMAAQSGLFASARAFFYSGALLLMLTVMLAMALSGYRPKNVARSHLLTLVGAYLGLPAVFAVPFHQAVGDTTWLNAYFEMVSSFTTTGASVFAPDRLDGSLHLWRAEVGWLGGLFVWITAAAIFAPLNLGGFEVSATSEPGRGVASASDGGRTAETTTQLIRVTVQLLPVYAGLTLVLWVCLIIAGDQSLVAVVHAMSTLSTSGISPAGGLTNATSSGPGEALIFLFLIFALSRRTYATEAALRTSARVIDDPEMRLGALLVAVVSAALFLRHFIGAGELGLETEAARQSAVGRAVGNALHGFVISDHHRIRFRKLGPGPGMVGAPDTGSGAGWAGADRWRGGHNRRRGQAVAGLCALHPWRSRTRTAGPPVAGGGNRQAGTGSASARGLYCMGFLYALRAVGGDDLGRHGRRGNRVRPRHGPDCRVAVHHRTTGPGRHGRRRQLGCLRGNSQMDNDGRDDFGQARDAGNHCAAQSRVLGALVARGRFGAGNS